MLAISNQPPIKMTASDVEGLWSLAETSLRGHPELTEFLVGEIARAKLVDADVAHDLVTMNSWVEFRYGLTNQNPEGAACLSCEGRHFGGKNFGNDTDRRGALRALGRSVHRMAHAVRR